MKLHTINTGNFKLDGGAMFGVVPKSLWNKQNPADENNMCTWALRCMLVEDGDRLTLIDTGIGDKQDEKFFSHYDLHNMQTLEQAIKAAGFGLDEVTDVLLTHLHFDHCGGAIQRNAAGTGFEPTFKNAKYWSNQLHWEWATNPNAREKASFLKENILPIQESGQLNFIAPHEWIRENALPGMDLLFVNGHTEAQMLPILNYNGHKIAFMGDLLASSYHVPMPWIMGYDMRPLLTLSEKEKFLPWAVENGVKLFFEHDAQHEMATVIQTEKGIRTGEFMQLSDL
ncbi:MAG: MBL fold metallo-hydrolase [Bacteroidota bacterium]